MKTAPEGREAKSFLWCVLGSDRLSLQARAPFILSVESFWHRNLNINLTWRLMSSARHLGNLQMLLSFLNSGTITSSTQAQKCSDELDVRFLEDICSQMRCLSNGQIPTKHIGVNISASEVVEELLVHLLVAQALVQMGNRLLEMSPSRSSWSDQLRYNLVLLDKYKNRTNARRYKQNNR